MHQRRPTFFFLKFIIFLVISAPKVRLKCRTPRSSWMLFRMGQGRGLAHAYLCLPTRAPRVIAQHHLATHLPARTSRGAGHNPPALPMPSRGQTHPETPGGVSRCHQLSQTGRLWGQQWGALPLRPGQAASGCGRLRERSHTDAGPSRVHLCKCPQIRGPRTYAVLPPHLRDTGISGKLKPLYL